MFRDWVRLILENWRYVSVYLPYLLQQWLGQNILCHFSCHRWSLGSLVYWNTSQGFLCLVYAIEGILQNGPYLPCVSMAGRALLVGYHRHVGVPWDTRLPQIYHASLLNSMITSGCSNNFKSAISEHMSRINFMGNFGEIAPRWIPHNSLDYKLTLVQIMTWCRQ